MYAWEPSLCKMVGGIREKELTCIRKQAYVMVAIGVTFFCAPYLVCNVLDQTVGILQYLIQLFHIFQR